MPNRFVTLLAHCGGVTPTLVIVALVCCCENGGEQSASELQAQQNARDELLLASAKVALPPPGVLPTALPDPESPGAVLMQRYCNACHDLPTPAIHSATDWPRVVRRMWLRMDGLAADHDIEIPASAERIIIMRYLIENALRVSGAALPPGPNRAFFVASCGRCHDLPDPRQYTYEAWDAVVQRMLLLLESMLGETLTQSENAMILEYLKVASQGPG